jgi:hypothetical protein
MPPNPNPYALYRVSLPQISPKPSRTHHIPIGRAFGTGYKVSTDDDVYLEYYSGKGFHINYSTCPT